MVPDSANVVLICSWRPPPHPLILLSPRDLLQLGGELVRTSRAVQEVGLGLSASLQRAESQAEAALEKQTLLQAQLEEQLRAKLLREKDLAQLQVQSDLDKADLSARWVAAGPSVTNSLPAEGFPGDSERSVFIRAAPSSGEPGWASQSLCLRFKELESRHKGS